MLFSCQTRTCGHLMLTLVGWNDRQNWVQRREIRWLCGHCRSGHEESVEVPKQSSPGMSLYNQLHFINQSLSTPLPSFFFLVFYFDIKKHPELIYKHTHFLKKIYVVFIITVSLCCLGMFKKIPIAENHISIYKKSCIKLCINKIKMTQGCDDRQNRV